MEPFDGQRWQAEQQRREQEERLRFEQEERLQRERDERLALEREAALREREFEEQAILNREAPAAKSWWQRLFGAPRQGSPGPRPPGARRRR